MRCSNPPLNPVTHRNFLQDPLPSKFRYVILECVLKSYRLNPKNILVEGICSIRLISANFA